MRDLGRTMTVLRHAGLLGALGLAGVRAGSVHAQDDWNFQTNPGSHLIGVTMLDSATGYATGFAGNVLKTTDGGRNWTLMTAPAVFIIVGRSWPEDDQTGWVTGLNGSIYKTTDGASSWTLQDTAAVSMYDVCFPASERSGWWLGDDGTIYRTVDGGANWLTHDSGTSEDLRWMSFPHDTSVGWIVGGNELILKRSGCRMETGTYTGDGTDGRVISGLAIKPVFVLIKGDLAQHGVIKTTFMPDDESKLTTSSSALLTNRIDTLNALSFTLGSDDDVNKSGDTYHWVAFGTSPSMKVGKYTGTGVAGNTISGLGFQPNMVWVMADDTGAPQFRTSAFPATYSTPFGLIEFKTDRITAFTADGFTVGGSDLVNGSGKTYYYGAWEAVAGEMDVGNYTGDGNDNRSVTGFGLQPEFVIVKADATEAAALRTESLADLDESLHVSNFANYSDAVQAFEADGIQIGQHSYVNTASTEYYYAAFGGKWSVLNSGSTDNYVGVDFVDESTGYLCGSNGILLKTTDGGQSWSDKSPGTGVALTSVSFPQVDRGWVVGDTGYIARTEDGGDNWTVESTPVSPTLWSVHFPEDAATGWAVGYKSGGQGTILRTATPLLKTGTYLGNATGGRAITGLGFQPDIVLIQGNAGHPFMRTSTMAGDITKKLTDAVSVAVASERITSLDADGFTIGADNDVNKVNETFFWVALKAQHEVVVGSYTGNGVNNRQITDPGFSPDLVIVFAEEDEPAGYKLSSMATLDSGTFGNSAPTTGYIKLLIATGFSVSNADEVNRSGYTYHWVAMKAIEDQIAVGSYTGDGWDDTSITGLGFQPDWVMIKADATEPSIHRPRSMGRRDTSLTFDNTGLSANRIQNLEPDGFQVGSDDAVNQAAQTYYWFAIGRDPTQPSQTPMVLQWQETDPR